jgi:hypothetical protein
MYKLCGFFLLLFFSACSPGPAANTQWDGTYIGYIHHNQQDTTPVTLVFEGKYFAAAPYGGEVEAESAGVFQDSRSSLTFQNATTALPRLNGVYKYRFGLDGSVRMWQENGAETNELILRLK